MIYTVKQQQVIKLEKTLQYRHVKDDLFVFSLTIHKASSPSYPSKDKKPSEKQGFVLKINLDKFLSYQVEGIQEEKEFALVSPEWLEDKRAFIHSCYDDKQSPEPLKPFDDFDRGIVIQGDGSDVYDMNGNVFPRAIHFDYMDGHMDNFDYNLEKAVEILSKNSQITLIPDRFREEFIQDIPNYNASKNCNQCIEFIFAPTKEQYQEIMKIHSKEISIQMACFNLDMFGLRAGGAANVETYNERYEKPSKREKFWEENE